VLEKVGKRDSNLGKFFLLLVIDSSRQRDWKWVILSKRQVKEIEGQPTEGVGSKVFPYGLYEGEWKNSKRHGIGIEHVPHAFSLKVFSIGVIRRTMR
jgi:hypothetical protein